MYYIKLTINKKEGLMPYLPRFDQVEEFLLDQNLMPEEFWYFTRLNLKRLDFTTDKD